MAPYVSLEVKKGGFPADGWQNRREQATASLW